MKEGHQKGHPGYDEESRIRYQDSKFKNLKVERGTHSGKNSAASLHHASTEPLRVPERQSR
jgi:hypothetical protein